MTRHRIWLSLPCLLVLPLIASSSGGWAVITLDHLPDHLITGQPVHLTFTLRQHGMTPLTDVKPTVSAWSGDRNVRAIAIPAGKPGRFAARLVVPQNGEWRITIDSDFGDSRVTLLPIRATAANATNGNASAAVASPWDRGRRLFVAKGCLTCHVHREIEGARVVPVGPDLSERRFAPDYLAMYLADPTIRPATGDLRMPDLDLDEAEIRALVAFINAQERPRR